MTQGIRRYLSACLALLEVSELQVISPQLRSQPKIQEMRGQMLHLISCSYFQHTALVSLRLRPSILTVQISHQSFSFIRIKQFINTLTQ